MSDIVVVIDLETTGISMDHDNIVQMAAVLLDLKAERAITLLSMYTNPGMEISEGAQEVHGISAEDVRWATPAVWALQHLKLTLDKLEEQGDVILVGHNHERFDIPMMHRILPSAGFNEYLTVDSYVAAMRKWPEMPHKLSEVFSWYCEKDPEGAHDASWDCHMVAEILMKYLKEEGIDIMQLVKEQEQPRVLDVWPFGKMKGVKVSDIPNSYLSWCRQNFTETSKDIEATICDALQCEPWTEGG